MTDTDSARRELPANPSIEFLRKQAKRLAADDDVKLAEAQKRLASRYGFASWPKLVAHVQARRPAVEAGGEPGSALSRAARVGDVAEVLHLLAQGANAEGEESEDNSPLWHACVGGGGDAERIAIVEALVAAGAQVRRGNVGGAPALCAAAARGPLKLVELLIRSGAREWQGDDAKRLPLDYARSGKARDREAIVHLLDRPVIDDAVLAAAVKAVQSGDLVGLKALLDRHPDVLKLRAKEPDCYGADYFRDPKLFWFIADNPILVKKLPKNIVAIAQAMIDRGIEQADLDYTLGLVITGAAARRQRLQGPLIRVLLKAGADGRGSMLSTLGHRERRAVEELLKAGVEMTATIAAGMGRIDYLARLLPEASAQEKPDAFSVAVINGEVACAKLCLDAGADVSAFLTTHAHSTAAHQAAINDDVAMLELLVSRGADLSVRDTLWDGTPLGWARHEGKKDAEGFLTKVLGARGET